MSPQWCRVVFSAISTSSTLQEAETETQYIQWHAKRMDHGPIFTILALANGKHNVQVQILYERLLPDVDI